MSIGICLATWRKTRCLRISRWLGVLQLLTNQTTDFVRLATAGCCREWFNPLNCQKDEGSGENNSSGATVSEVIYWTVLQQHPIDYAVWWPRKNNCKYPNLLTYVIVQLKNPCTIGDGILEDGKISVTGVSFYLSRVNSGFKKFNIVKNEQL